MPKPFYTTEFVLLEDGTYECTIVWEGAFIPYQSPTGLYDSNGVLTYQAQNIDSMRTLSEICIDADNNSDDSVKLFNLLEEVKYGTLSESQSSYAKEYINSKIEVLKDNIRRQRARNKFEED